MGSRIMGHLMAFITIVIWGTTYISTKILFEAFTPVEIVFYRFMLAFVLLVVLYPKNLKFLSWKTEFHFFLLGFFGVTLYYLMENWALKYTYASNVSLYASAIPLFTAIIAHYTTKDERFSIHFLVGFTLAMFGIFLVIFNGTLMKLNPIGDFLAILASVIFAIYTVLIRKLDSTINQLIVVRKTFFYGVLTMIPFMLIPGDTVVQMRNVSAPIILNFLFLTLIASLLCFVMYNRAIGIIGSIKASNYIYIMPLVTIITSMFFLDEKISMLMVIGGILIIAGVYLNESKKIKALFERKMSA